MSRFWSKIVNQLTPYVPGEQPKKNNLVKLNTNENPYGPSPEVISTISLLNNDSLRLYPDPNSDELKNTIANYFNLTSKQIFVGNGSDEILAHTFQALLKQENAILFPDITYSFYPVYCNLYDIAYKTIPLDDSFNIELSKFQIPNGGIIFPNPNAPTGNCLNSNLIEQLLEFNRDSVVVIDEAYIDFGGKSVTSLIDKYENLLVIQTLSKSRSLAGLRVGYAMGNEDLIEALERVKNSFNSYPLDRIAIGAAVASFNDQQYFDNICNKIITSRTRLSNQLLKLGFEVLPSKANFLFVRHSQHDATQLSQELRNRSIIVRHFSANRINQYLRITVGTNMECGKLVDALENILAMPS